MSQQDGGRDLIDAIPAGFREGQRQVRLSTLTVLALVPLVLTVYVDDTIGLAVMIFGVLVAFGLRRLSLLGAVGLLLPFMFIASPGFAVNLGLVDLLLPAMLIATVSACWRNPLLTSTLQTPLGYSIAFLSWAGLSYLLATASGDYFASGTGFAVEAAKLAVCFTLFGSVSVLFARDFAAGKIDLLNTWSAMAIATGLVGSLELFLSLSVGARFTAGFENPNLLSLYLVTSLAVSVLRRMVLGLNPLGVELVVIAGGILAAGGRGSFFAVLVFIALTPILAGSRGILSGLAAVLVAASLGSLALVFGEHIPVFERILEQDRDVAGDIRLTLWAAALELWRESPVFGVGLGQFSEISPLFTNLEIKYVAHNTYLSILAETGAIGFVGLFSLFSIVAFRTYSLRRMGVSFGMAAIVWLPILVNMLSLNAENARFVWVYLAICHGIYWAIIGQVKSNVRTFDGGVRAPR